MSGWIDVNVKLPEDKEIVLLSGEGGRYHCDKGYIEQGRWYIKLSSVQDAVIGYVTHWMPKPDYPQEPVKEWLMSGEEK